MQEGWFGVLFSYFSSFCKGETTFNSAWLEVTLEIQEREGCAHLPNHCGFLKIHFEQLRFWDLFQPSNPWCSSSVSKKLEKKNWLMCCVFVVVKVVSHPCQEEMFSERFVCRAHPLLGSNWVRWLLRRKLRHLPMTKNVVFVYFFDALPTSAVKSFWNLLFFLKEWVAMLTFNKRASAHVRELQCDHLCVNAWFSTHSTWVSFLLEHYTFRQVAFFCAIVQKTILMQILWRWIDDLRTHIFVCNFFSSHSHLYQGVIFSRCSLFNCVHVLNKLNSQQGTKCSLFL